MAVITAWLHDVHEDCPSEWIQKTDELIAGLPLPVDERQDIAMMEALPKKNT